MGGAAIAETVVHAGESAYVDYANAAVVVVPQSLGDSSECEEGGHIAAKVAIEKRGRMYVGVELQPKSAITTNNLPSVQELLTQDGQFTQPSLELIKERSELFCK
jgi:hypothetical protein